MEKQVNSTIKGYGYTANPKHGTNGVQNLPTNIATSDLYWTLMGGSAGKDLGAPAWSADPVTLLTKVLIEGRGDAGVNEYNYKNPQADALFKQVEQLITSPEFSNNARDAAMYPAAALDKTAVAKRLGIPIERAWNGTGRSAATGKTGQDHANKTDAATKANVALDPRNAAILDYVTRGLNNQLTQQEHLAARLPTLERKKLTTGGLRGDQIREYILNSLAPEDLNSKKAARMLTYETAQDTGQAMYRAAAGVPKQASQTRWVTEPTSTQKTEADIATSLPAVRAILNQLLGIGN
jgi:hypothetical protein